MGRTVSCYPGATARAIDMSPIRPFYGISVGKPEIHLDRNDGQKTCFQTTCIEVHMAMRQNIGQEDAY